MSNQIPESGSEPEAQGYVNQDGPEIKDTMGLGTPNAAEDTLEAFDASVPGDAIDHVDADPPMPLSILEQMALEENDSHARKLEEINELRTGLEVLQGAALLFGGEVRRRTWFNGIEWVIKVNAFNEALPMLEHLSVCGYEDPTSDDEAYQDGRRFKLSRGLSLLALLNEDTPSCKKVIVGWTVHEPSPKYAFECKDEPTPDYHEGAGDV